MPISLADPAMPHSSARKIGATAPVQRWKDNVRGPESARWFQRTIVAAFAGWLGIAAVNAASPLRTLDLVTFAAPVGWTVEEKSGGIGKHVVVSRASPTSYCMIVIYSGTPASATLEASFAAEWKGVALQTIDPVPTPTTTIRTIGNTRAAVGIALSRTGGQPVMGMLVVLDAGTSVVSVLILAPTVAAFDPYNDDVQGMLASFAVQRMREVAPAPVTATGGKIVIPAPTRTLVIADLAGEWGLSDGFSETYVDRSTGAYAGTDSLHFTEKWFITAEGKISLDFFAIRNGKKIIEKSSGTVRLSTDGILSITMSNQQRYVLRGWLEAPSMTVMKLNGPWYDHIPPEILANPQQGANLDKKWVRPVKGQ